jgi:hypothetical protein
VYTHRGGHRKRERERDIEREHADKKAYFLDTFYFIHAGSMSICKYDARRTARPATKTTTIKLRVLREAFGCTTACPLVAEFFNCSSGEETCWYFQKKQSSFIHGY